MGWPLFSLLVLGAAILPVLAETGWDFIIVGGGTAGLTLALRLAEIPKWNILVLEAGIDHAGDIRVTTPGLFGSMYGGDDSPYHWNINATPQTGLHHHAHPLLAGKGLGGGSAINYMFWTHASRRDIDNWGALGNPGWSWETLQPYFTKSERFVKPSAQQKSALNLSFVEPSVHGYDGPIVNSFPSSSNPLQEAWPATFANLGLGVDGDPRGGQALGGYPHTFNIDPGTSQRSYPGSVYTSLAKSRPNLKVLTGALVTKVLLERVGGIPTAVGVSCRVHGKPLKVKARKEVILSAGGLASPKLLELSGIGNRKLLEKLGIKTMVDNPQVGENYQNHIMVPLGFAVKPGIPTGEDFLNPAVFQSAMTEYLTNRTGPLASINAGSSLLSLSQIGTSLSNLTNLPTSNPHTHPSLRAQHQLLLNNLASNAAAAQIIYFVGGFSPWLYADVSRTFVPPNDGGNYYTILGLLQHPFSRGSIHIQSSDATIPPMVDTQDLSHPLDVEIAKALTLQLQKITSTSPLSSFLQGNGTVFQRGYHKLTEENVEGYVKEYALVAAHYAGTCAMMPRNKGGVVDNRLKVHGVGRLRVVDGSVFPMVPQGTVNSAVVGVAERAADLVKGDYGV